MRLERRLAMSLLALALAQAVPAQPPIIVEVLAKEGDALSTGVVATLHAVTANASGVVAAIGQGSSSSIEFRFTGSAGYQESTALSLDSVTQVQIGLSESGEVAWLPVSGGANALFVDTLEIVDSLDSINVDGGMVGVDEIRRPHYSASGALYTHHVDDSFKDRLLKYESGSWANVLSEDDDLDIGGYSYFGFSSISSTYDVAFSGSVDQVLSLVRLATGNYDGTGSPDTVTTSNDERVLLNGNTWVALEGDSIEGTTWSAFTVVSVNGSEEAAVGGQALSGAALGFYDLGLSGSGEPPRMTPVDGLLEGSVIDGVTLGGEVHAVSLNDDGHLAFLWEDSLGAGALFVDCDPSDLVDAHLVLREGDVVDFDPSAGPPDGTMDGTITSIPVPLSSGARLFDLASAGNDSGEIGLLVLIDDDVHVVKISYDCDCVENGTSSIGDLTSQDWDQDGICGLSDPCPLDANHEDVNPANGTPDCAEAGNVFSDDFESGGLGAWSSRRPN